MIDDGYKKCELGIVIICAVWREGETEENNNPKRMAYRLRNGPRKDYKELADGVKLPRERPRRVAEKLYPVEIVERSEEKVKVHYIGYDSCHDEWKEAGELEMYDGGLQLEPYVPLSLFTELRYLVKCALNSGSRRDPVVRIELAFDRVLFDGGLAKHGYMKNIVIRSN